MFIECSMWTTQEHYTYKQKMVTDNVHMWTLNECCKNVGNKLNSLWTYDARLQRFAYMQTLNKHHEHCMNVYLRTFMNVHDVSLIFGISEHLQTCIKCSIKVRAMFKLFTNIYKIMFSYEHYLSSLLVHLMFLRTFCTHEKCSVFGWVIQP